MDVVHTTTKARRARRKTTPPPTETERDYARIAREYAAEVDRNKLVVGNGVRKAVARHLRDLVQSKEVPLYPYRYDPMKGARVCRFIETLPHVKGRWAARNELLFLSPWQVWLVMTLFSWVRKSTGLRRFREVYWRIPRKNGKSVLAAAIGLYMLMHDHEFGAEVYSGATTEKQAWEVFGPARLMAQRTPALLKYFGLEVWSKVVTKPRDNSKFEPIIGNPGDGSSPSCAIVDEFHEHLTPALFDTMQTGMGSREQPLLLAITTAGYNIAGPCFEKEDEATKVLDGTLANEELFAVLFGIDVDDDWADPKALEKANPNFNVSIDAEFLLAQQRNAMANPIQQNKFKTKHLNVWCSVLSAWMNMQLWTLATDRLLDEDDLVEAQADWWISLDLASKSDLCAEMKLARRIINDKPHFYLFGRYWLPEETIEEPSQNHAHYVKWVRKGLLTQTDGATVDFDAIIEQVVADCKRLNPKEFVFDPFIATQTAQRVAEAGVKPVVEFNQLPHNFAVPMDELLAALKDGRFHHDGNEITTWCMSNVVARPAKKGLVAPVKAKPHQKIDGAIATIMAFARAIAAKEKERAYQMLSL